MKISDNYPFPNVKAFHISSLHSLQMEDFRSEMDILWIYFEWTHAQQQ